MFLSRVQLFIITTIINIILPVLVLSGLFLINEGHLFSKIIFILSASLIFLLFMTAPWEFTNYYFRYSLVLIFAIANWIFFTSSASIQNITGIRVLIDALAGIPTLILIYFNINAAVTCKKPEDCIHLTFPFKDGKYIITDGGDGTVSSLMNYHYKAQIHKNGKSNTSMRYATAV